MPRKVRVVISERQQAYLRRLTQSDVCPPEVADRAQIVLFAYDKCNNATIADRLGCGRRTVREWRNRWAGGFDRLVRIECLESDAEFRVALVEALMDDPMSEHATAERLADDLVASGGTRHASETYGSAGTAAALA